MSTRTLDLNQLKNMQPKGSKTIAQCPACAEAGGDAKGNHLVITGTGADGSPIFGCVVHRGQNPDATLHRKRILELAGTSVSGLRANRIPPAGPRARPSLTFTTADEAARHYAPPDAVLEAVYLYPRNSVAFAAVARYRLPAGKTFRQFHCDGGTWEIGGPDRAWPLYRIDEIPSEGLVYLVEGEKCQDAAAGIGIEVTTSAGGSSAAHTSDWTPLAGRDVVILPDNDEAGDQYARDVATILAKLAPPARAKVVRLPVIETGADIVDFLDSRDAQPPETLRAEIEAIAARVKWEHGATVSATVSATELISAPPPPHNAIVSELFDVGATVEVIGPSKVRKSFYVMQLALCLASGRNFAGLNVCVERRVLLANLELTPDDFHRRLWHMARALRIETADLVDRMHVLHLRGKPAADALVSIESAATMERCEILVIDPVYTLVSGEENRPEAWLPLVSRFNEWATRFGAVLYVHHDAKGDISARDIRDRGAGSNVLGRNAYARMTLTPHKCDSDNAVVLAFMLRGYPPRDKVSLTFEDGAFVHSELPPDEQTQADRRTKARSQKATDYRAPAVALVDAGPISPKLFRARLSQLGLSVRASESLLEELTSVGAPLVRWTTKSFPKSHFVGTPQQRDRYAQSHSLDTAGDRRTLEVPNPGQTHTPPL